MNISEVRISPAKGGKVRAFASIVVEDCFIINDLRVMEGKEGQLYVTMPARKVRSGQMREIAHPLNAETRKTIEDRVLEEFHQAEENLVVPPRRGGGGSGKKDNRTAMDRLATKLFADDFWLADAPRHDGSPDPGKSE
jgi:stage V sporulation protein G